MGSVTRQAHGAGKRLKGCNPVFDVGMGREQVVHPLPGQRIDDEHMGHRRIGFGVLIGDNLRAVRDFRQRARQRVGIAANFRAKPVGRVFARAADRHLHEHGGQRRENGQRNRADHARPIAAIAAKQQAPLGDGGDRTRERRSDRHGQRVAIFDVRQLMRDHARQLLPGQHGHQPGVDGHRRIFGIAPGGEGVGLVFVDHVDARHRQLRAPGQFGHHVVEIGRVGALDFLRAVGRQRQPVGIPIGEQVCGGGKSQRQQHAGLAAEQRADDEKQRRHGGHQHGGAHHVHGRSLRRICKSLRCNTSALYVGTLARPLQGSPRDKFE